jgi:hypothetical protein
MSLCPYLPPEVGAGSFPLTLFEGLVEPVVGGVVRQNNRGSTIYRGYPRPSLGRGPVHGQDRRSSLVQIGLVDAEAFLDERLNGK